MTIKRGEVWLASLDPVKGSEQAGTRPVIVFQENTLSKFTTTVITIPITSNLRRASSINSFRRSNTMQVTREIRGDNN
jgi:mRNA interferase MazF